MIFGCFENICNLTGIKLKATRRHVSRACWGYFPDGAVSNTLLSSFQLFQESEAPRHNQDKTVRSDQLLACSSLNVLTCSRSTCSHGENKYFDIRPILKSGNRVVKPRVEISCCCCYGRSSYSCSCQVGTHRILARSSPEICILLGILFSGYISLILELEKHVLLEILIKYKI